MPEIKSNSRTNTLIVLEILKKHSSMDHPISNSTVLQLAKAELRQMGILDPETAPADGEKKKAASRQLSTSTITRILDNLALMSHDYPSFVKLIDGRVCIRFASNVPGRDGYVTYDPDKDDPEEDNYDPNNSLKGKTRYYCFDPLFTEEEINILATSVAANPFLSLQQNQELNDKIMELFPVQLSATSRSRRAILPRTMDSAHEHLSTETLLDNISTLLTYIRKNQRIRINYGKYDLENHCLISRSQNQFTELEPVTITWSNGYVYLLAVKVKDYEKRDLSSEIFHYRIDRIIEIRGAWTADNQPVYCSLIQNLDTSMDVLEYQKHHPVMYAGKLQTITFLAKDMENAPLANMLVDTFGLEYRIRKADESDEIYLGDLLAEAPDSWYRISVTATPLGTELWAMQQADRVRIISPDSVVDNMRKRFEIARVLNAF